MPWHTTMVINFYEFTESLPVEHVIKWTLAVEKWEDDPTQENLFVLTTKSKLNMLAIIHIALTVTLTAITQHDVHLALAKQEGVCSCSQQYASLNSHHDRP